MMRGPMAGSIRALGFVSALGLLASGCSSAPGASDPGDTLGNLFAFNSTTAPPVAANQSVNNLNVICPVVDVRDGGAAHRVYSGGGASNAEVRYQFTISDTARECAVENNQIVIRVGVEGKVLLGPAGSPSSFTVPVYIGIRKDEGQQTLSQKVYNVAASIPAGSTHTSFSVVSEPLVVPYTRQNAAADYTIWVGFEGQRETRPREARRRAR